MNVVVTALHDKFHSLQEQVARLQHSDIIRKIKKVKRYIQKHAILFTVLGIIALLTLSPFLVILAVVMAPMFLLLVVSSSFVFVLLFNFAVVVFAGAASCYILYRITWFAIHCIQTCLSFVASCPSRIYQYFKVRMYELFSQLLDGFTGGLAQQNVHNVEECSESNDSSELEDIEPDYRDRETKLYEALVSRPQYTGQDTFEPFQY